MTRGCSSPGTGRKVGLGRRGEAHQVVQLPISRNPAIQAWLETPRWGLSRRAWSWPTRALPGPSSPPGSLLAFPLRQMSTSRAPLISISRNWTSMGRLRAHHPDFAPIVLRPGQGLQIWGVGGVVRRLP